MTKKRLLIQCQLSNYDSNHNFILECDSGWQMVLGRVRVILEQYDNIVIDIMCPNYEDCVTSPEIINSDLWKKFGPSGNRRLNYIQHKIIPNALATRYDFAFENLTKDLFQDRTMIYDAVYLNDPMHLRNFKAMFHLAGHKSTKFYVHSHFIDNPECPKFPTEASLWLGQCEAAIKADHNFWQCESSMYTFLESATKWFKEDVIDLIAEKSTPWDDGYSKTEITLPIDESKLRFDPSLVLEMIEGKTVIFVPNRIGGKGISSDYTNCGKFMFEMLPKIKQLLGDKYIVFAGNPSQKFSNQQLIQLCGEFGYRSLVPDSFRRDEFKWIASHSNIALGLYDQDTYGGTAARECIELGCFPLWLNNFEYKSLAKRANISELLSNTLDEVPRTLQKIMSIEPNKLNELQSNIRIIVRKQCSYELTTHSALIKMGLINE